MNCFKLAIFSLRSRKSTRACVMRKMTDAIDLRRTSVLPCKGQGAKRSLTGCQEFSGKQPLPVAQHCACDKTARPSSGKSKAHERVRKFVPLQKRALLKAAK
ncbi:hypothetical protein TRVL_01882 [Trypanosoma vivax]|nr:hypothetical protein TRVL_01882 [Trypanosoma vivax]